MNTPPINDGGPIYPYNWINLEAGHYEGRYEISYQHPGMSLRDYFIAHSGQPGTSEVYLLRGCPELPKPLGWLDEHWYGDQNIPSRATKYWETLNLQERYAAYAELRCMLADAMLAARQVRQ
jgi:hypothetical protein